jgi:hydroxyacylglutathione hydrolase
MFSDNYGYVIVDKENFATCVDPGVADIFLDQNFKISQIICTHKHSDHVGGNLELKKFSPDAKIIGTTYEDIPGLTHPVYDGDRFSIGKLQVDVIHTPCHTRGHVCFYISNPNNDSMDPVLFSGDTLFVGGCGRFFEGCN